MQASDSCCNGRFDEDNAVAEQDSPSGEPELENPLHPCSLVVQL